MPPYSRSILRYRRKKYASYPRTRLYYQRKFASYSRSRPTMKEDVDPNRVNKLPQDLLVAIFQKVGTIDVTLNVQKVCVLWRKICRDPVIWRSIDIDNIRKLMDLPSFREVKEQYPFNVIRLTEKAIDRSCGQLININLEYIGNDNLLKYITDRKIQLKCLQITWCTISDEGLSEATKMMSSMEELHVNFGDIKHVGIENVGLNCPGLKSLTYKRPGRVTTTGYGEDSNDEITGNEVDDGIEPNSVALAISRTMPQLKQLNLFGNYEMTNEGLKTILDSCPLLESLDLRKCFGVDLKSDPKLEKRCSSIKVFRHPNDSVDPLEDLQSCDPSDIYFFDTEEWWG